MSPSFATGRHDPISETSPANLILQPPQWLVLDAFNDQPPSILVAKSNDLHGRKSVEHIHSQPSIPNHFSVHFCWPKVLSMCSCFVSVEVLQLRDQYHESYQPQGRTQWLS